MRFAEGNVAVFHTGYVSRLNPAILTSTCEIDITYFPVDDQICKLIFGSWTYSLKFLDIRAKRNQAGLSE